MGVRDRPGSGFPSEVQLLGTRVTDGFAEEVFVCLWGFLGEGEVKVSSLNSTHKRIVCCGLIALVTTCVLVVESSDVVSEFLVRSLFDRG